MNTLEKAELTTSARHIEIFLESRKPICNAEGPDSTGIKTRRRRI